MFWLLCCWVSSMMLGEARAPPSRAPREGKTGTCRSNKSDKKTYLISLILAQLSACPSLGRSAAVCAAWTSPIVAISCP